MRSQLHGLEASGCKCEFTIAVYSFMIAPGQCAHHASFLFGPSAEVHDMQLRSNWRHEGTKCERHLGGRIANVLVVGPSSALAFGGAVEFDQASAAAFHAITFFFKAAATATHSVRYCCLSSEI